MKRAHPFILPWEAQCFFMQVNSTWNVLLVLLSTPFVDLLIVFFWCFRNHRKGEMATFSRLSFLLFQTLLFYLGQWLLTRDNCVLGDMWYRLGIFFAVTTEDGGMWVEPRMLLNILWCTVRVAQNVKSAMVEKLCVQVMSLPNPPHTPSKSHEIICWEASMVLVGKCTDDGGRLSYLSLAQ